MKYLQQKKVPIYDLMGGRLQLKRGSKFEGIQRFKLNLGGKMCVGKTFKKVLRPTRFKLFNMLVAAYFRLYGGHYKGDPIDQTHQLLKKSPYSMRSIH